MDLPEEDGIYSYVGGRWQRLSVEGPLVPETDGIHVIYFRNSKCPGCRSFDGVWREFVQMHYSVVNIFVIQCKSFFVECSDSSASDTFVFYLVFETPQVVALVVESGYPVYIEREVGVLDAETLRSFVLGVRERMSTAPLDESGEEGEGIYIDISTKNWKKIVEQLKKLVIEGKALRELCDERGCKIVVG
uniref:Thioredoxin n=1 Tax=Ignisphaera aggregans TaxID=334771 RepID=A0A7C2ZN21_9CREN